MNGKRMRGRPKGSGQVVGDELRLATIADHLVTGRAASVTEAAGLVDAAMDDSGLRRLRRKFRQHSLALMQAAQQRHAPPPPPVNYGKQLADSAVREIAAAIEWAVSGKPTGVRGGIGCMDWLEEPLTVGSIMRRVAAETAFPRVGDAVAGGIGSVLSSTVTRPAGQLMRETMVAAERPWIGGAVAGGIGATVTSMMHRPVGEIMREAMAAATPRIGGAVAGGIGAAVGEHAMLRPSMNRALPW